MKLDGLYSLIDLILIRFGQNIISLETQGIKLDWCMSQRVIVC